MAYYVIAEISDNANWQYAVYNTASKTWSISPDREETIYYDEGRLEEAGEDYVAISTAFPSYEFSIEYIGTW